MSGLDLALANLTSPMVLFFVLGFAAALARSDLSVPEAIAKALALYLMLAIGFKGGVEINRTGIDSRMLGAIGAGALLSAAIPLVGYGLLRLTTRLSAVDAAAVAAHYGSISIVTFVAGTEAVRLAGWPFEGYLVAVAAIMETPAIMVALLLARRAAPDRRGEPVGALLREIGLNGSIVMLIGSFIIGAITGPKGLAMIDPFIGAPFRGILCLFLLDMGLVAGRGLREGGKLLSLPVIAFGLYMPLISAALAAGFCLVLPLSPGGAALLITLSASASYIAVPAAMRLALPEARPAIYLTLSLAVTFPFNLTIGLPLYLFLAARVSGGA
ncbi:sodium-dependent bicarbonate transport family permease [Rhabdaerophilum sp. SD176]|uniref:sodium-dependent bicarbonate transport family permease n=1 Tax=Rhabdaerophilum sp. SD176 TaxID=2983548 RepID=UPI0024E01B6E|nr:sodium-dependent bicarbonate transport family permease [Rhabdaerophilum sp. SD176]